MKYLITGKNGQVAAAFMKRFTEEGVSFSALDRAGLDISDYTGVVEAVSRHRPDVILNCAAYNHVDRAEDERDLAEAVNAQGPRNLASAAEKYRSFLVHFGTDYVFDGSKEDGQYVEEDAVNPLNAYGRSKLLGERLVHGETERFLIARVSWVFGHGRQNFIQKLMEWSEHADTLKISCDEFSVPTHADTIAEMTIRALEHGLSGLYHLTNSGFCSRYEWAKTVFNIVGKKKFIRPVPSDTFRLPAQRPKFSAMSNEKLSTLLGVAIPPWDEAVRSFITGRPVHR